MGLTKKIIKCTITFVKNPDFTCDLWIWQNIPNDLGIYRGYFERIKNHKRLQIEANEGTWEFLNHPTLGRDETLDFFKTSRKSNNWHTHFIMLGGVPFDFIDQVIAGKELSSTHPAGSGVLYKPVSFLNWRMWC
jgi:hypothetical protein